MDVELKVTKLTKSKIAQMDYTGIPTNPNVDVFGWVNMDKKRWVIVKSHGSFYRADFIVEVKKEMGNIQFASKDGGWEFPYLTQVKCKSFNGGISNFIVERNDEENIKLYDHLISFKRKTEKAGQIYY